MRHASRWRIAQAVLGAAVVVGLLWRFGADATSVLRRINLAWASVVLLLVILQQILLAYAWRNYLLAVDRKPPSHSALMAALAALPAIAVFPGGVFVRVSALAAQGEKADTRVAWSIALEKWDAIFVQGVVLGIGGAALLLWSAVPRNAWLLLAAGAGFVTAWFLPWGTRWGLVRSLVRPLEGMTNAARAFGPHRRAAFRLQAVSLAMIVPIGLAAALAAGLDADLKVVAAAVATAYAISVIPVTPGGLGTVEALGAALLAGAGSALDAAMAFFITLRLLRVLAFALTGSVAGIALAVRQPHR